eukprot:gene9198-10158_t
MNLIRRNLLVSLRRVNTLGEISYFSTSAPAVATTTETVTAEVKNNGKNRHTKEKKTFPLLNAHNAIAEMRNACWASFDESVEIAINTGLDPRKPNQSVKGVARLPFGTGKKTRICVFAKGADIEAALAAGADVAGVDEVVALIQGGDVNFNTVIATPDCMPTVSKLGRILGPRGLMPNPKMGTVTTDVEKAVKAAKAGAIQFKVEKKGVIQAGVGKVSFTNEALLENIRSLMLAVQDVKPEGFKGKYIRAVHISSTMGPGIEIELPYVDPANPRFMLNM